MIKTRDHPDRQVALRIFCFLRCRRDGIETDEGKKNNCRAAHDAAKSARQNGCQLVGLTMNEPKAMTKTTTATLIMTIVVLVLALSRIP